MPTVYTPGEIDPAKRAAEELDLTIEADVAAAQPEEEMRTIEEERQGERISQTTERTAARLLVLTTDTSAFLEDGQMLNRLTTLAAIFAEIHVIVCNKKSDQNFAPVRPLENLWIYATNARHWLDMLQESKLIAAEQLEFGGGFRPDIVIAFDPYEAAVAAIGIAKKYDRPFQLHLDHDIFDTIYQKHLEHRFRRNIMVRYVMRNTDSLRAATRAIATAITDRFPKLASVTEVVPQHIDLRSIADAPNTGTIAARYPQYNFIATFIGPITHQSGAFEALNAAAGILRYPTMALLFIGDGPATKALEEEARARGVLERVLIAPPGITELMALKETHMLIYPDGKDADERTLLKAAAAGLPIVAGFSPFVNEIFTANESIYVCPMGDVPCLQQCTNELLNQSAIRKKFARNAQEEVFERVVQDADEYIVAFKDSVERVIYEQSDTAAADPS